MALACRVACGASAGSIDIMGSCRRCVNTPGTAKTDKRETETLFLHITHQMLMAGMCSSIKNE